jgi:hypothetical protein
MLPKKIKRKSPRGGISFALLAPLATQLGTTHAVPGSVFVHPTWLDEVITMMRGKYKAAPVALSGPRAPAPTGGRKARGEAPRPREQRSPEPRPEPRPETSPEPNPEMSEQVKLGGPSASCPSGPRTPSARNSRSTRANHARRTTLSYGNGNGNICESPVRIRQVPGSVVRLGER